MPEYRHYRPNDDEPPMSAQVLFVLGLTAIAILLAAGFLTWAIQ